MSVSSQITRLSQAKAAIKAAIKAKGVDVPDATLLDGMADAIKSIPSRDNIVHADIPDYIKTAALEVAKKVQAVRTSESIVFIAASDAHQLDTSADIVAGNKHAGMAMKALAYILPGIDFACYLGDYTAGSTSRRSMPISARLLKVFRNLERLGIMMACNIARRKTVVCCPLRSCTMLSARIMLAQSWAVPQAGIAIEILITKNSG